MPAARHDVHDDTYPALPAPRLPTYQKPRWDREGQDWPNRTSSSFIYAAGIRWHVQQMGRGPVLLLVHGTGAATHSWRVLAPLLAQHFTVVAPDLPGHGFTDTPAVERLSLEAMAADLGALLRGLGHRPMIAAGHSAGAAVLARMCLDGTIAPRCLIGLNGALLPIGGMAGQMMLPLARVLAMCSFVPRLFARFATTDGVVHKMITDTGSALEPAGVEFYRRLVSTPGHVAAAIGMMANWRLTRLARELPQLAAQLLLIAGSNDKTIAWKDATRVQAMVPGAQIAVLPGLGHLAHEERPDQVSGLMLNLACSAGLLPARRAAME